MSLRALAIMRVSSPFSLLSLSLSLFSLSPPFLPFFCLFVLRVGGCKLTCTRQPQQVMRTLWLGLLSMDPSLVDARTADYYQKTPLHLAAANGHDGVVAQLLAFSPQSSDARSHGGQTALHLAAENGHDKIVARLSLIAFFKAIKPGL